MYFSVTVVVFAINGGKTEEKMKREAEIREIFIENAISLIAEGGFEKATTKELAHYRTHSPDIKMNEAYIYRIFGSKEKLYEAVFEHLDNELYVAFMQGVEAVRGFNYELRERMYNFFLSAWSFAIKNEERFRCYVRYYYSPYFKGNVLEEHDKLFMGVVNQLKGLFKEEADVVAILHCAFTTFLDFAIRVYNRELEDSEINRPHIFNVLYLTISYYFKKTT